MSVAVFATGGRAVSVTMITRNHVFRHADSRYFGSPLFSAPSLGALGSCPSRLPLDPPLAAASLAAVVLVVIVLVVVGIGVLVVVVVFVLMVVSSSSSSSSGSTSSNIKQHHK